MTRSARPAGSGDQPSDALLVDLPVGEANAVVRLSQIAHATKRTRRPPAWSTPGPSSPCLVLRHQLCTHGYPRGHQLSALFQAGVQPVDHQCSGAQSQMYIAGTKLLETYAVPPLLHNQALAISVTSYNACSITESMRRDAMSDVDLLPGLLGQSLDELLEASR